MRFFTDEAERDDGEWGRRVSAYSEHLATIKSGLPEDLKALATEPAFDLHDGRFVLVELDRTTKRLTVLVDVGSMQVGYRRLSMTFDAAEIAPDNLHLLAEAVGASFSPNHWHTGIAVTEIRWQEVDIKSDGRFVLRLRLWPFHEFEIRFGAVSQSVEELPSRPAARPGRFVVHD